LFEAVGDIEKVNDGLEPEPEPEPACVLSPGHIVATSTWITVVGNIYDDNTGSPPSVSLLFNGATTGIADEVKLVLVLARAADMETMDMDMLLSTGAFAFGSGPC
jgi:hypothetical protein